MVLRKTGWRIVTLAVAVYAAASADGSAQVRPPPLPPGDIPGASGTLVWGGPMPDASGGYVPSPALGEPAAPFHEPPPPVAYEPPPAAEPPPPERGPGDYGRTYPVREAGEVSALAGPASGETHHPDEGLAEDEGVSDVPSYAALERQVPMPANPPPPAVLSDEAPSGYRAMAGADAQCRRELRQLGVRFTDVASVSSGRSCGIDNPVRVTQAASGIAMSPPATLSCPAALKVARWLEGDVKPAARWKLWRKPVAVINMSSYRCSRIAGSRTISEHAGGNALDVGGFRFSDGSTVRVEPKGFFRFRERGFQDAIRRGSCRHFGTVLGPGYNRAHADHLHLDVKRRLRPVCK